MIILDIATNIPLTNLSEHIVCECRYYFGPHCHHSMTIKDFPTGYEKEAVKKALVKFKEKMKSHSLKALNTTLPARNRLTNDEVTFLNTDPVEDSDH